MLIQPKIEIADKEELVSAILKKHESCQLENIAVEKNVDRFLQLYKGSLWVETLINFEFIKNLVYLPTLETSRISETMRESFWNKKWQITTKSILSNAMHVTAVSLRKIIEKTDELGNPTHSSHSTSSITVVTQKFKNLLNPHTEKDKEIQPFLDGLENTTQKLTQMRMEIIDPIVDKFLVHTETNFYEDDIRLPPLNDIQDCIDLCETYCQSILSFYLNTHYALDGLKDQIASDLWSILNALRMYSEYLEARDDILKIAIHEKSHSKKHDKIAKRLMEIIEPRLYEAMCISEQLNE